MAGDVCLSSQVCVMESDLIRSRHQPVVPFRSNLIQGCLVAIVGLRHRAVAIERELNTGCVSGRIRCGITVTDAALVSRLLSKTGPCCRESS